MDEEREDKPKDVRNQLETFVGLNLATLVDLSQNVRQGQTHLEVVHKLNQVAFFFDLDWH
jgi:hypothetical protein